METMLVVEPKMLPIPDDIQVLNDWGYVGVVDGKGTPVASGDHMHLSGDEAAFRRWLSKYDGVWRTKPGTSPMMQRFEVVHID